ncbi:hypothetical protein ACT8ZV_13560 [Nocardioides sp. MAHUQ-72]|uniref:hypothetical protein n=1 Tax=unclassified Nocardioides TaxID=2615069 RepID=UPI003621EBD9
MTRLIDDLNTLHASYVDAINAAVAENDLTRAEELAAGYDSDAIRMIAEREGRTDLLPIRRPERPDTPLRRLVAKLGALRAA